MFKTDYLRLYLRDIYSANMSLTKSGQNPFDSATLAELHDE